jgi:hypothetical protein
MARHPEPISVSAVQGLPSSHAVGHAPGWPAGIAASHHSPASTLPFPQTGGAGGGGGGGGSQISVWAHDTWHPLPLSTSAVQSSPSSQLIVQLPHAPAGMPGSHFSPASSFPSPQLGGGGQVFACAQETWQPLPISVSAVQLLPSLQS